MTTILSCVATPDRPSLSSLAVPPAPGLPQLLTQLTVEMRVHLGEKDWQSDLLDWSDGASHSLRLRTRRAGQTPEDAAWDDIQQNYLSFPDASGACDVLEAEITLRNHRPEWNRMRVGVPAARLGKRGVFAIVLRFTGASLSLFVDGVRVDEDWTVGQIPTLAAPLHLGHPAFNGIIERVNICADALTDDQIRQLAGGPERAARRDIEILGPERCCAQYWTPPGHNQWVGDVMLGDCALHPGDALRLFYLVDRRHGASKFGCGAHSICSMSSTDLVHWQHHPVAFELEQWETVGTGRVIVHDGRLLLFYGLHTGRIMPERCLVIPTVDASGRTIPMAFPKGDHYPQGTSFASSADGIAFTESRRLVHPAQNPAVSREAQGDGWLLLAGYGARGLWHSDDLEHWRLIDEHIIPFNLDSLVRNSDECQCLFEWNGWHYIIAGRTGFWMSRQQRGPYWEGKDGKNGGVARPRWDIYDGLWVPMVGAFADNRRILAGFLQGPDYDWAGHLVLRELVQYGDGTLGMKWLEEVMPAVSSWTRPIVRQGGKLLEEQRVSVNDAPSSWPLIEAVPSSFRLAMRIESSAASAHIAIAVLDEQNSGCALSLLTRTGCAQWNSVNGLALPQVVPTLQEILAGDDRFIWEMAENRHVPFRGCDFAITQVEGLSAPCQLEMLFFYDAKSRSTIIDACLNGQRTLVTRRKGLVARQICLMADGPCSFEMIRLGALQ